MTIIDSAHVLCLLVLWQINYGHCMSCFKIITQNKTIKPEKLFCTCRNNTSRTSISSKWSYY